MSKSKPLDGASKSCFRFPSKGKVGVTPTPLVMFAIASEPCFKAPNTFHAVL